MLIVLWKAFVISPPAAYWVLKQVHFAFCLAWAQNMICEHTRWISEGLEATAKSFPKLAKSQMKSPLHLVLTGCQGCRPVAPNSQTMSN